VDKGSVGQGFFPRNSVFPFFHYHSISAEYSGIIDRNYINLKLTEFQTKPTILRITWSTINTLCVTVRSFLL
jgi:hypothetical protein